MSKNFIRSLLMISVVFKSLLTKMSYEVKNYKLKKYNLIKNFQ